MASPEDDAALPPSDHDPAAPPPPVALTPELAAFLRAHEGYACLAHATSAGTAYLVKTPAADLASLRGTIPVSLRHELYDHPAAPVLRTVLTLYDRPEAPLRLETFCNVADPEQRADFAALADQEEVLLLFYDEALQHRLSKRVPTPNREDIPLLLGWADDRRAATPASIYDFDRAKAAVLRQTTL